MTRAARQKGFSLIEMVVAIGLLGAILVTVESLLSSSTLIETTHFGGVALGLAESELDRLRAGGYGALPASGPVADSDLTLLPSGAESVAVADYATNLKSVTVTVSWVEPRAGNRSVSLSTIIAKVGGLP